MTDLNSVNELLSQSGLFVMVRPDDKGNNVLLLCKVLSTKVLTEKKEEDLEFNLDEED